MPGNYYAIRIAPAAVERARVVRSRFGDTHSGFIAGGCRDYVGQLRADFRVTSHKKSGIARVERVMRLKIHDETARLNSGVTAITCSLGAGVIRVIRVIRLIGGIRVTG